MDLREYYNFPYNTNVSLQFTPSFYDIEEPLFPCSTDMKDAFRCYNGSSIPLIDTSKVTNMTYMFNGCSNLKATKNILKMDTSNVTSMQNMFGSCTSLTSIDLSPLDTSKVTNMSGMFSSCGKLKTINFSPSNTSKVTDMQNLLNGCTSLTTMSAINVESITSSSYGQLFGYSSISSLTNVGGLLGLKTSITSNCWDRCANLTYQSCINILNGLFDFVSAGQTPTSSQGKLKVHSNFLKAVGDEIAIGTAKGWTITA